MSIRPCLGNTCERESIAKGLCDKHYRLWRRTGSLETTRDKPIVRFWSFVKKHPSGCWVWTGALVKDQDGEYTYGHFTVNGRSVKAHVWSWELHHGRKRPRQLVCDHLCMNKRCVNPDHLEMVTNAVNIQRWSAAIVTACPQGHRYTPENTLWWKRTGSGGVKRRCRACEDDRNAVRRGEAAQRHGAVTH